MNELSYIHEGLRHLAVHIDELTPDPDNAKIHNEENETNVYNSLKNFGQRLPIVVQKQGMIVRAGNNRLKQTRKLGRSYIAAIVCDESDVEAMAYALVDNRSSEAGASWNIEALTANMLRIGTGLEDFEVPPFEVTDLGWSADEVDALIDMPEPKIESSSSEKAQPAIEIDDGDVVTRLGDVWECGEHRLVCESSAKGSVVDALLHDAHPIVVFSSIRSKLSFEQQAHVGRHLANDGSWFVHTRPSHECGLRSTYIVELIETFVNQWEWLYVDAYCWHRKGVQGEFHNRFRNDWESVHHFTITDEIVYNPKSVLQDSAKTLPGNVISIESENNDVPIALPTHFILAFSEKGDVVYDPVAGTGSTLLAAVMQGRQFRGCESSPKDCEIAVRSWVAMTGQEAHLMRNGVKVATL